MLSISHASTKEEHGHYIRLLRKEKERRNLFLHSCLKGLCDWIGLRNVAQSLLSFRFHGLCPFFPTEFLRVRSQVWQVTGGSQEDRLPLSWVLGPRGWQRVNPGKDSSLQTLTFHGESVLSLDLRIEKYWEAQLWPWIQRHSFQSRFISH